MKQILFQKIITYVICFLGKKDMNIKNSNSCDPLIWIEIKTLKEWQL